jgi:adenylate kinase
VIPGARLIILGRQGAGKGTQCVRLSRHYVVPHISTGDMLRAAVRERTELGLMAKEVMDAGGLVSDDIMIGLVDERLQRPDAVTRGYILDGFPRTVAQAEALAGRLEELGRPLDAVVSLGVGEDELRRRLAGRAEEQDRAEDDDEDAIRRRLELFDRETEPLLDFYDDRRLLVRVEAEGEPDEVAERIAKALTGRPGREGAA